MRLWKCFFFHDTFYKKRRAGMNDTAKALVLLQKSFKNLATDFICPDLKLGKDELSGIIYMEYEDSNKEEIENVFKNTPQLYRIFRNSNAKTSDIDKMLSEMQDIKTKAQEQEKLNIGDRVKVISGLLAQSIGTIQDIQDENVIIGVEMFFDAKEVNFTVPKSSIIKINE